MWIPAGYIAAGIALLWMTYCLVPAIDDWLADRQTRKEDKALRRQMQPRGTTKPRRIAGTVALILVLAFAVALGLTRQHDRANQPSATSEPARSY